jgi:hypothetical protein
LLEERARGAGLRLAEWVREVLLAAPAESGPQRDSGEVALAEVLALRSLFPQSPVPGGQRARRHTTTLTRSVTTCEGTKWAQKGHKTGVLHGFAGSYMAAKSL